MTADQFRRLCPTLIHFRILNSMFWVFDQSSVNAGVLNHLREASPVGVLSAVTLSTDTLPDDVIDRIRLSRINGGGSYGAFARGTATYQRPADWSRWMASKGNWNFRGAFG